MTTNNISDKYITAFKSILTADDLHQAAQEVDDYSKTLPPAPLQKLVSGAVGHLPIIAKKAIVGQATRKADKKPDKTTQAYISKLNSRTFVLSDDGQQLVNAGSTTHLTNLFTKDNSEKWPTLALVSNGNFVSPQFFFDSFSAAKDILPNITNSTADKIVVAGSYFSDRHVYANANTTLKRYEELGLAPRKGDHLSPAADMELCQLLDILLERNPDGSVVIDTDKKQPEMSDYKPVLRSDSTEILEHVIGYGYSAAHMIHKDALRELSILISQGEVRVHKGITYNLPKTRDTTRKDAKKLMSHVRLIGVAGMDRMDAKTPFAAPKEVNFVSKDDFSMRINGKKFLHAPNVIPIKTSKDSIGGHSQQTYIDALNSNKNKAAIEQARSALQGGLTLG